MSEKTLFVNEPQNNLAAMRFHRLAREDCQLSDQVRKQQNVLDKRESTLKINWLNSTPGLPGKLRTDISIPSYEEDIS